MEQKNLPQEAFVKIEYKDRVNTKDLAKYLAAISDEYKSFVKNKQIDKEFSDELYIREIEKGSIEIFFSLEYLAGVLPLLSDTNTVFEFINYITNMLNMFKSNSVKEDLPIQRVRNYKNINGILGDVNIEKLNYIDNRGGTLQIINSYGKNDAQLIEDNIHNRLETEKRKRK